eukprot:TRINITY_DN68202_c7_g2_i1.p1 TRINITY_DN68202_c7_g2~~TRINITY_DN68202_c7_g2_i1.p1  ORF type:complete len:290 (-),score=33.26 TRINITY_DN68202_c7_g2_i1:553-1422(-)
MYHHQYFPQRTTNQQPTLGQVHDLLHTLKSDIGSFKEDINDKIGNINDKINNELIPAVVSAADLGKPNVKPAWPFKPGWSDCLGFALGTPDYVRTELPLSNIDNWNSQKWATALQKAFKMKIAGCVPLTSRRSLAVLAKMCKDDLLVAFAAEQDNHWAARKGGIVGHKLSTHHWPHYFDTFDLILHPEVEYKPMVAYIVQTWPAQSAKGATLGHHLKHTTPEPIPERTLHLDEEQSTPSTKSDISAWLTSGPVAIASIDAAKRLGPQIIEPMAAPTPLGAVWRYAVTPF